MTHTEAEPAQKPWVDLTVEQKARIHNECADSISLAIELTLAEVRKTAAQPAPVQELQRYSPNGEGGMEVDSLGAYVKHQDVTTPPAAQPAPVQGPLHDEKVWLIAHNECPEDWDSLDNKECWLKGFVSGFKTAEREYKE